MAGVFGSRVASALRLSVAMSSCVVMLVVCGNALASPPRYELVKKFGPDGSQTSDFVAAGPVAIDQQTHVVYAADGNLFNAGKLYKFDGDGSPMAWGGSVPYISGNEISGLEFFEEGSVQIAVDSSSHTIYVTSSNSITAFEPSGEPSEFTAGSGAGTNAIGGFSHLAGLAVDSNGFIYASDRAEGVVKIFAPTGELVNQFTTEEPANLAVDSSGSVYVARYLGTVTKFQPSAPLPVTSVTTYTPASEPVDPQASYTVAVDPATTNVYIAHLNSSPGVAVYTESGSPITTFGEPGAAGELFIAGGIAIDPDSAVTGEGLRVYVGNSSSEGSSQINIFRPEPPASPKIEVATAGSVSSTSAILHARINPNQLATTYWFEYGSEDCSISACTSVPLGGGAIGAGNDGVWVAQAVQGLNASTQYHYRVIGENALGSAEQSGVFSTQGNDIGSALSDSRVWEMVSPANKRGARLLGTAAFGGLVQASADGNGIAYVSLGSIEAEPQGNRALEVSSVLARRDATGWRSKDITPPNTNVTPILIGQQGEYKLFSQDLSRAVLDPRSGTPLSSEASERAPYLRENTDPPNYKPLVTGKEGFANVPSGTEFGGGNHFISAVNIDDATPDLSHVVLSSSVPLVAGAPDSFSIYEWVSGNLKPISVLPFDEGGAIVEADNVGSGIASMRHAISDDGSRVFWTGPEGPNHHLYMREMNAGETVRVDQVQSGAGAGEEKPVFQGASTDGEVVFFTDTQQLTEGSSPTGSDLYRCEIINAETGCLNLVDLTAPAEGSGESAEVQGVVSGLSVDGSRAYFVAEGVLVGAANQFGDGAVSGQPNLYLWQEGKGLRFIATLAAEDRPDWGLAATTPPPGRTSELSAANSPSGRYFAFMSERNLTDQANVDPNSGEAVERVFRYDADANRLHCVGCAPTGAAPHGALIEEEANELVDPRSQWIGRQVAATLPQPLILGEAGTTIYQPRAVLDNGRVFFNAVDSLVAGDSNNQWDVYQYEDFGVGDCTASSESADVARSGGGCVSLMSSGTGQTEVGFLDASLTGNDIFFLSPARLSVIDTDNELDLYDARVGGTAAVLAPTQECASSESCHSPAAQMPEVAPGSTSFVGPGNLKAARKCPKGKRRVKQGEKKRCVKRRKGGKKHHHRRAAGHRKGAGR